MSFLADLLNNQINNILNGIHSVSGLVFRAGETSYRAANASDIVTALLNGTITDQQKKQLRDLIGVSATGFMPKAHVNSTGSLPASGNQIGDCYSVGSSSPYSIYVWNGSSWVDFGAMSVSVTWGNVSGTLSNQTDLNSALNNKQNKITLTGILRGNGQSAISTTNIQTSDIENGAITSGKVASNAITDAKIVAGAVSATATATLLSTGWGASAESGGGFIQTVTCTGLLTTDTKFFVDLNTGSISGDANIIAARKAWSGCADVECAVNNQITVHMSTEPRVNIPIKVYIIRK